MFEDYKLKPDNLSECRPLGEVRLDEPLAWEMISDQVMGGCSTGELNLLVERQGKACACLQGDVSLENNGGFLQMKSPLPADINAGDFQGLFIELLGGGHAVDIRLKTTDLQRPWQSFRVALEPAPEWQTWWLPFSAFQPHRTEAALDPEQLRSVAVVAIGEAMRVDVCVATWGLYR
ncbi:MAG: hypothetical protein EA348_05470 [Pseudomonadaceae bacterium]|nr:MAG: hypothetical protein EA348_05470 [Pseudomonadaceae bacterium]